MEPQPDIWIIWLFFALFYGLMAIYHWRLSKKRFIKFDLPEIPYLKPPPGGIPVNIGVTAKDVKETFDSYGNAFNSYIEDYNKSSRRQNRAAAGGFLIACFAAVASLVITI
jgi:hypothetical protein